MMPNPQFERRDYTGTVELREDGEATKLVGYAAVFNRLSEDLGGFVERIAPGAFKEVLGQGHNILGLFNHSMDNLLASRTSGTLRLEEDEFGLRYEIDLDASDPDHQRVMSKVRRKDLSGSSFAFRSTHDEWATTEADYPMRTVTHVTHLRDVGPVTVPAYPDTAARPLALRSLAELTDRPVEELAEATDLRDFLLRTAEEAEADGAFGETDAPSGDINLPPSPGASPGWWQHAFN